MVARTGLVFAPEPADSPFVEHAAVAQAAVGQQFVRHRGERSPEPFADRGLEAVLGAVDDLARDPAFQQPAEQVLASTVLHLEGRRNRRGKLEQLVIEQRYACLERNSHAHLVDLGQDIVDEVGLDVDVECPVQRIGRRARVVCAAESGERVDLADGSRELRCVQRLSLARIE